MPTERQDLDRPRDLPRGTVAFDRDARLFATRRGLVDRLRAQREIVRLVPDELLHPQPPCDLVVRRGNLRVSELLDDGREVTRAVLQAGATCRVREDAPPAATARATTATAAPAPVGDPAGSPLYSLGHAVLTALGEAEIWKLPAGALDAD